MATELREGREKEPRDLPEAIGKGPRAVLGEGFGREKVSPEGVFLAARPLPPGVAPIVPYGGTQGAVKGMFSFLVWGLAATISTMIP
jgi:hypothetical protein